MAATLTRMDLHVLSAACAQPSATAKELAEALGESAAAVSRSRRKLQVRGVWRPAFEVDLDRAEPEPLVVLVGRLAEGARPRESVEPLRRALADHDISGAFLAEGGSFVGLALPRGIAKLHALDAALFAARVPRARNPLVLSLARATFPRSARRRRAWLDYGPFLRAAASSSFGERVAHLPGPRPAPRGSRARPLTATEAIVAKELVLHPERPLAESTRSLRLPQSTFAHVKMALLEERVLRPAVRIAPQALGYPHLFAALQSHRPGDVLSLESDVASHPCAASAPVAALVSERFGFSLTPCRDLACVREAQGDFERRSAHAELVEPPVSFALNLAEAASAGYTAPADAAGAEFRSWLPL